MFVFDFSGVTICGEGRGVKTMIIACREGAEAATARDPVDAANAGAGVDRGNNTGQDTETVRNEEEEV
jgi:ribose 5-phosphate isomerase RpiB